MSLSTKITRFSRFNPLTTMNRLYGNLNTNKVAIITGVTGKRGAEAVIQAVGRGYKVVACSRNISQMRNTERVTHVKTSSEDIRDSQNWKKIFIKFGQNAKEILVLNTIGAPYSVCGLSLKEINEDPALAIGQGLDLASKSIPAKLDMVQLSSSAASINGENEPYSAAKKRTDNRLMTEVKTHTISLLPGLVFTPMHVENVIDWGHAYTPEGIVSLSYLTGGRTLIGGSGKQVLQPVYSSDLMEAIFNVPNFKESMIVDAVGRDVITQLEMAKWLRNLQGNDFNPLHINLDFPEIISKKVPLGLVMPYAIMILKNQEDPNVNKPFSRKPFKELVGKPLKGLEIYAENEQRAKVFVRPPVLSHAAKVVKEAVKDPKNFGFPLLKALLNIRRNPDWGVSEINGLVDSKN